MKAGNSRKNSPRHAWAQALFLVVVGIGFAWAGIEINRTHWLLKNRGQRTQGTLENVTQKTHLTYFIPTFRTYMFEVSFHDQNGKLHKVYTEVSGDMLEKNTVGNTKFTHHPIDVVFLADDPKVSGLPEMLGISIFPLLIGSIIFLVGARGIHPLVRGRRRPKQGLKRESKGSPPLMR